MTDQITIPRALAKSWLNTICYTQRSMGYDSILERAIVEIRAELSAPATEPATEQIEQSNIDKLEAENNDLRTVMMAAAVEIQEHWGAHCDADGYGPVNLMRRLEGGYPEQYGYNAETVVRLKAENDRLKTLADSEGPRAVEYLRRVSKAEDEVKQLRKDAERYRWLAEYLVSDDEFYDDAIVAARTNAELDSVIDAARKGTP